MSIVTKDIIWYRGYFVKQLDPDSFEQTKEDMISAYKDRTNYIYGHPDVYNGVFFSSSRSIASIYADPFKRDVQYDNEDSNFDEGYSFLESAKIKTEKIFDCADVFKDRNPKILLRDISELSDVGREFFEFLQTYHHVKSDAALKLARRMRYYDHALFNPYICEQFNEVCLANVVKDLGYHGFFERDAKGDEEVSLLFFEREDFNRKLGFLPLAICIFNEYAPTFIDIEKVQYRYVNEEDFETYTPWRTLWKK